MQPLEELEPDTCIFERLESNGHFHFKEDLSVDTISNTGRNMKKIDEQCALALALTEICCHNGEGKVFYLRTPKPPTWKKLNAEKKEKAISIWYRLPLLIYKPYTWSDTRRHAWLKLNHLDRYTQLNAQCGGLATRDFLLPIDYPLVSMIDTQGRVLLNAYQTGAAGCKATVIVCPKMHLAWREEIQPHCQSLTLEGSSMDKGERAWLAVTKAALAQFVISDEARLVEKLLEMFLARKPNSIISYGYVVDSLCELDAVVQGT